MVLSQLSYSPKVCSDLSIAITGEPVADYRPQASPTLLPGEFGLTRARRRIAWLAPSQARFRADLLLLFTTCAYEVGRRFRAAGASGAEGIRTPDLYSAIVALSQLSYSPGKEA